jgi:hypothetical protein
VDDENERNSNLDEDLLAESGFSQEDKAEIIDEIENIISANKIKISSDLFKLRPKRRGVFFPIFINVLAAGLLVGGYFYFTDYYQVRAENLLIEKSEFISVEGQLIESVKEDAERKLQEKDTEINQIQERLESLDSERETLIADMEDSIRQRENQLRESLESELQQEIERLQGSGLSEEDIQAQVQAFEQERQAEFDSTLADFKAAETAALQEKENELSGLKDQLQDTLDQTSRERTQLAAEAEAREEELRLQYEEESTQLQERTSIAEQQYSQLSGQQEREEFITNQMISLYSKTRWFISTGDTDSALSALASLEGMLSEESLRDAPNLMKRRDIEQFFIDTLRSQIGEKDLMNPEQKAFLEQTTKLFDDIRLQINQGDQYLKDGKNDLAKASYESAFKQIPELSGAYEKIDEMDKTVFKGEIQALENKIGDLEGTLGRRNSRIETLSGTITSVQNQLETAEAEIAGLEETNREIRGDYASLEQDYLQKNDDYTILEEDYHLKTEELSSLAGEIEDLTAENRGLLSDVEISQEEYQLLDEEYILALEDNTVLAEEITALEEEQGTLENLVGVLEEEKEVLETVNTDLNTEKTEVLQRIGDLENYKNSIAGLGSIYEENRDTARSLSSKNDLESSSTAWDRILATFDNETAAGIFPGIRSEIESIFTNIVAGNNDKVLEEGKTEGLALGMTEGKSEAYDNVLTFVQYAAGDKITDEESTRQKIVTETDIDTSYGRVVAEIQNLVARGVVREDVGVLRYSLLGTVLTTSLPSITVEKLVEQSVTPGSSVQVLRHDGTNDSTIIAEGQIVSASGTRVTVKVSSLDGTAEDLRFGDLVYLNTP